MNVDPHCIAHGIYIPHPSQAVCSQVVAKLGIPLLDCRHHWMGRTEYTLSEDIWIGCFTQRYNISSFKNKVQENTSCFGNVTCELNCSNI